MKKIIKYFKHISFVLSSLLLFYFIYESEIYLRGTNREYYFSYYFVLSAIILFSSISFVSKENLKSYLKIIFISIIFTLYMTESYLTFFNDPLKNRIIIYKKKTGNSYDTRTIFEIYEDLYKKDKTVVIDVPPAYHLDKKNNTLIPLAGISNSKTVNCNENGYYSMYQSDRFGFNNPDNEWDKKNIEFFLVGDSYAQGECVNRPNDMTSVLRKLSKKSALNLGYASSGPLVEYATLREYLRPNVKNVIWIYFEYNDLNDLNRELKNKTLNKYLQNLSFIQNLKFKQNEINEINRTVVRQQKEMRRDQSVKNKNIKHKILKFIRLNKLKNNIQKEIPLKKKSDTFDDFHKILKNAKDLSNKNKSNFYFVYLPEFSRYKSKYNNDTYKKIKTIVEKLNIPFIDIDKEVFKKESNPLELFPFELPGHYNVKGYKKVSEAIYNFILDQ